MLLSFDTSQASVMVEYTYEEAVTFLETNLKNTLDKQVNYWLICRW